jgi:hypothetical protein
MGGMARATCTQLRNARSRLIRIADEKHGERLVAIRGIATGEDQLP